MEGEDGNSNDANAFCKKSAWKRFLVLVSGATMNILLGFLIFVFLVSVTPSRGSNMMGEIIPRSVAEQVGLKTGDKIIKMESENFSSGINTYSDISFFKYQNQNAETAITVKRGNEKITFYLTPTSIDGGNEPVFGFTSAPFEKNFWNVIYVSFCESVFVVKLVLISFWQLITGTAPLSSVAGPVGIVSEINTAAQNGYLSVLSLAALISINLGIVNLFPFPALDGGRILLLIIEKIRRKPMSQNHEATINFIGMIILLLFALIITFFDVGRLFGA